ncbi:MAG: hypothetical protein ACKO96_33220 [Flammeovirgaceae bacterium]
MTLARFILPLVFFAVSTCWAQTDYAITAKGDTLRGDVKILPSDLADQVQVKINKKKEILLCTEAITVVQGGILYKTVKFDNRFRYMTLLKDGFLSLYGFRMPQQTSYDGRYLQTRDGRGLEMPNLTFKRSLAKFLEDCPAVSERVKSGDLGRNDIEKILDEFNTCLQLKTTKRNVDVPVSTAILSNTQEVDNLIKKVEDSPDFANKKDAIDLLKDLSGKVYRDEILPSYLLRELRANLKDQPTFSEDLEKILAKTKTK